MPCIRRTLLAYLLESFLQWVHADDLVRSGDPGALDDELTDASRTDDEDARARRDPCREEHRTDACQRSASKECGMLDWDVDAKRKRNLLLDDQLLGQGPGRCPAVDRLPVEGY